jgi:N-acetylglutamate synthase-like GNAT family acetyltransferase
MTTRILPPEEWHRLAGTLLAHAWPQFSPETTEIVVVEDGDQIVACAARFMVWHLEGAWIAPSARGRVSVGRRLLRGVTASLRDAGIRDVWMMATDVEGQRLCERLGHATHLDCEHFEVRMEPRWA